ncbi:hypothetical protein EHV15_28340 [Paenibacillus oralis]|uniref:Uncharacterized protein n=1 Tax=Paenibacillus oralis TaxID=2490856 RepID=A0A3P3U8A3_9BACL|nr:hypothetical protein [Paenibacillus oralis]RRJ66394.1 hypothetical protein EHV15_28340 [Paenibacillus oralis]
MAHQMGLNEKYYVCGHITIPVCFPTKSTSRKKALDYVSKILNEKTVSAIHGDIFTWKSSASYPLTASDVSIIWDKVLSEHEID